MKQSITNPINPGDKVEDANIGDPRPKENNSPGVVACLDTGPLTMGWSKQSAGNNV